MPGFRLRALLSRLTSMAKSEHAEKENRQLSKEYLLEQMTWQEAKAAFEHTSVAVTSIGSTEQHGPHLPVGTGSGCWPGLLGVEATHLSKSSSRRVCQPLRCSNCHECRPPLELLPI
jgi:hypothetical protein